LAADVHLTGSLGSRKKPGDSGTSFAEMKYAFEKKLTHGILGNRTNNHPQRSKIKDGNTWQWKIPELDGCFNDIQ